MDDEIFPLFSKRAGFENFFKTLALYYNIVVSTSIAAEVNHHSSNEVRSYFLNLGRNGLSEARKCI